MMDTALWNVSVASLGLSLKKKESCVRRCIENVLPERLINAISFSWLTAISILGPLVLSFFNSLKKES